MGCCQSSPRSPAASPYHNSPPGPRPLNVATNTHTFSRSPLTHPGAGSLRATTAAATTSLSRTPNAPLRRPSVWTSGKRTWSRSALSRERDEFFDTRVTGRSEVWGVVRLVVENIRQGDLVGAQSVLDASGCTCPTGDVRQGVFDELGALYQVPQWVLSDPRNVVEDGWKGAEVEEDNSKGEEQEEDNKRDEKGKGRVVEVKDAVRIRARLSDRGTDVVVAIEKDQNVKVLVRRIQEEAGISEGTKVKLAYLGKILKDNQSLSTQGWQPGHVVNALIFE